MRLENLAGHKLPTGYPSRRSWIRFTVRDRNGTPVFESGEIRSTGEIPGNDNDTDPARYEPHYQEITQSDQVQVYESVMVDTQDQVTTGLLQGVRYIKDNRLLPRGFDKATASEDIAVHGQAREDDDFIGGSDAVRYIIHLGGQQGPFIVQASLWYQPIGYRWAHNLKDYDAPETNRFVEFYDSMSEISGIPLATAEVVVPGPETSVSSRRPGLRPDLHVAFQARNLVVIDILAYLPAKLFDPAVRPVFLEFPKHPVTQVRNRKDILVAGRIQIDRHEDELLQPRNLLVVHVLAYFPAELCDVGVRFVFVELMGHPVADPGNQKNFFFGCVIQIQRQEKPGVQLVLLGFIQRCTDQRVDLKHIHKRTLRKNRVRLRCIHMGQRRELGFGGRVRIEHAHILTHLGLGNTVAENQE